MNILMDLREPFDLEEGECAFCWVRNTGFKISETPETEWAEKRREGD